MLYQLLKIFKYIIRNIKNKTYTLIFRNSFGKVGTNLIVFRGLYCSDSKKIFVGDSVLIDQDCSFTSEFKDSTLIINDM